MITSVSRIMNILCIMFQIIAFCIITLFCRFYVRMDILLAFGKHLHDRIISLRGDGWSYKTGLTPPLFTEVHIPNQESQWSCICVCQGYRYCLFYDLILNFRIVPTVWYFCFSFYFSTKEQLILQDKFSYCKFSTHILNILLTIPQSILITMEF